jgi:peroxiredoxin
MNDTRSRRLHELEQKFAGLEGELEESPQKQALSLLHAIVQEVHRAAGPRGDGERRPAVDAANLYRQAPSMEKSTTSTPLPDGTPAPDFALPDPTGRLVRLSDFRGRPVVLVFYPLDWSPGCSQQLDLYQNDLAELEKRGAQLLAISVDSLYSHGAWAAVRGLGFPLLADFHPRGDVAKRYQVFREDDGFSDRVVYVVDPAGVIRGHQRGEQLNHVPDVGELLEMLDTVAQAEPAEVGA